MNFPVERRPVFFTDLKTLFSPNKPITENLGLPFDFNIWIKVEVDEILEPTLWEPAWYDKN